MESKMKLLLYCHSYARQVIEKDVNRFIAVVYCRPAADDSELHIQNRSGVVDKCDKLSN